MVIREVGWFDLGILEISKGNPMNQPIQIHTYRIY
jgi:hypothetical protein